VRPRDIPRDRGHTLPRPCSDPGACTQNAADLADSGADTENNLPSRKGAEAASREETQGTKAPESTGRSRWPRRLGCPPASALPRFNLSPSTVRHDFDLVGLKDLLAVLRSPGIGSECGTRTMSSHAMYVAVPRYPINTAVHTLHPTQP